MNIRRFGLALFFCLGWTASVNAEPPVPDMSGKILTVLGPIDPQQAGITLPHEHIFIDFTLPLDQPERWIQAERRLPETKEALNIWHMPVDLAHLHFIMNNLWENRDALLLQDTETSVREVMAFKQVGGSTIVDVTSVGLGRDPQKLKEIAQRTGLNIVMGAGWYRRAWHPEGHENRSVESLTAEIVRDITTGVDGTGIRSGIIGEVAAMDIVTEPSDSIEVKGVRAAARASRLTGAAITLHQWVRDGVALHKTLNIIEEEGGNLSRVIVGHMDAVSSQNFTYLKSVLDRGVTLEFDLLGTPYFLESPKLDDRPMADAVIRLVKAGYGDQILLSQDICTKIQQKTYGGKGFDYVLSHVVPYMRTQGLPESDIQQMLVTNPTRLLTFVAPEQYEGDLGKN